MLNVILFLCCFNPWQILNLHTYGVKIVFPCSKSGDRWLHIHILNCVDHPFTEKYEGVSNFCLSNFLYFFVPSLSYSLSSIAPFLLFHLILYHQQQLFILSLSFHFLFLLASLISAPASFSVSFHIFDIYEPQTCPQRWKQYMQTLPCIL